MKSQLRGKTIVVGRITYTVFSIRGGKLLKTWARVGTERKEVTATTETKLREKLLKISTDIMAGNIEAARLDAQDNRAYLAAVDTLKPFAIAPDLAAREYADARTKLGDATISDAIRFYLAHGNQVRVKMTVAELIEEFKKKRLVKRSDAYREVTEADLDRLSRAVGSKQLLDVTASDLETVVAGTGRMSAGKLRPSGPFRREQVRKTFITLFRFGQNPNLKALPPGQTVAHALEKEDCFAEQKPVWDPEHLRRALQIVAAEETDWLAWTAISALANVRSHGALRLDWKELSFADQLVDLPAAKSKKKQRTTVAISPELRSWLQPVWKMSGPIADGTRWRHGDFCERLRKKYGLPYYKNVLRRSHITYRVALTGDEALVALETGTSISEIRQTYTRVRTFSNRLVTKELAEKWFGTGRVLAENVVEPEFSAFA